MNPTPLINWIWRQGEPSATLALDVWEAMADDSFDVVFDIVFDTTTP